MIGEGRRGRVIVQVDLRKIRSRAMVVVARVKRKLKASITTTTTTTTRIFPAKTSSKAQPSGA